VVIEHAGAVDARWCVHLQRQRAVLLPMSVRTDC
jgi:hypothetical protein